MNKSVTTYDNFTYIMRLMMAEGFTPKKIQFVLNTKEPTERIDFGNGTVAHYCEITDSFGIWRFEHPDSNDNKNENENEASKDIPDYEGAFKLACKYLQKGYVDSEDRRGWTVMDWEVFIFKKLEDENETN